MTPLQFLDSYPIEDVTSVVEQAGTNLANFKQIARYNGGCGRKLAKSLAEASQNRMTLLEILYAEDYGNSAA